MVKILRMVAVLLMVTALSAFAQTPKWAAIQDGAGLEIGVTLEKTTDGNVVTLSKFQSFETGLTTNYGLFNLKDGTTSEVKTYTSEVTKGNNYNIVLNKLDVHTGKILWSVSTTHGDFSKDEMSMSATSDNGMIVFLKIRQAQKAERVMDEAVLCQFVNNDGTKTVVAQPASVPSTNYQPLLVKISAEGKVEWTKVFSCAATDAFSIGDIVTDAEDNIYLGGNFSAELNLGEKATFKAMRNKKSDLFFAKFNSKGEALWGVTSAGDQIEEEKIVSVDLLNGKLYFQGYIKGDGAKSVKLGEAAIVPAAKKSGVYGAVSTEGKFEWAKVLNSAPNESTNGKCNFKPMCITADGEDIYLGGSFGGDLFDNEGQMVLTANTHMLQAYVIKCNAKNGAVENAIFVEPSIGEIESINLKDNKVYASSYVLNKGAYVYILNKQLEASSLENLILNEPTAASQGSLMVDDLLLSMTRGSKTSKIGEQTFTSEFTDNVGGWFVIFTCFDLSDAATGVEEIEMSQSNGNVWPADIYNIQGKKVKANATSLEGLPKGIYIVNGKKMIL